MKKALMAGTALSLGVAALIAGNMSAVEGITTFDVLQACLEQEEAATCTLGGDIAVKAPITVKNTITLNLNGKTISVDGANWDIVNGSFNASKAHDQGIITVNHGANLTVSGAGTITTGDTEVYSAIRMTNETNDSEKAILTVNDATIAGYYYGIVGNGSEHRGNTLINLNGATVKGLNAADCFGIYQPQLGELNINKGTKVSGAGGIAIKSGTLNINGGSVTGEGAFKATVPFNNGANPTGSALLIESNDGYSDHMNIAIKGGTLTSVNGYVIDEYKKSVETKASIQSFAITGGEFFGAEGIFRNQTALPGVVSGGVFGIADDLDVEDFVNLYMNKAYSYTHDANKDTLTIHQVVQSEALPEGYNADMEHQDASYFPPEAIAGPIADIVKSAGIKGDFKLTQVETITIKNSEGIAVSELGEPVTFAVVIDEANRTPAEGYARKWYVVRIHGEDEYVTLDCAYDAATGSVVFSTDLFSDFLVGYVDTKIEENVPGAPQTGTFTGSTTIKSANLAFAVLADTITTAGALALVRKASRR